MSQHPVSTNSRNFNFNLDVSGVAGFFGGDEAVQAMMTIHLYKARRWSGWYNAPGSFAIAKYLGPIANSRFWNALFPGPNKDPEEVFGLDNQLGPKYIASQSGTIIDKTTHLAYLLAQKSKEVRPLNKVMGRPGRKTQPMTLTVVKVNDMFGVQSETRPQDSSQLHDSEKTPTTIVGVLDHNKWLAIMPILASLSTCGLCAYNRDWYCFAMILLGVISNGLTYLVVGSAFVVLKGVKPADNAPPGDGMLVDDSSNHIVILKGEERAVNGVTKGRFCLEYTPDARCRRAPTDPRSDPEAQRNEIGPKEYRSIGLCSLLLGMQSLLQLLLIPQGTLFGQFMFLSSFVISWVYNLYLSSLDKEKVQQQLLFRTLKVGPMSKFELGTRTTAAVFAALVLRPPPESASASFEASKLLKCFLPNETAVWNKWRKHIGRHIETVNWTQDTDWEENLKSLKTCDDTELRKEERDLLAELLDDAGDAFQGYFEFFLSGNQGVGGGKNASGFRREWSSSTKSRRTAEHAPLSN
ncbi:hypothetical protein DEU56DRAFT_915330 [Suillus clintonianus]|uniref:uncharacterized protein n=1 Tax=Suillus clintonianus TaxID=1904413 RepID=UPI001B861BAA|nr:uncharacterized protein DEU56DRAFT_915330 [Suillus clintonianus]KAG2129015.1 hypothetical protein DEU56DRAFT_915330 [Suillus clintonianus]